MGTRIRSRAGLLVGSLILDLSLIMSGAPVVLAQDQVTTPDPATICQGWGTSMLSPEAGGITAVIPSCAFDTVPAAEVPLIGELGLGQALGEGTPFFFVPDGQADQFVLGDGSRPPDADPAANIVGVYHASLDLGRSDVRGLRRSLADLPQGARLTSPGPVRDVLQDGPWHVLVVDTEGDPTRRPEQQRVFQIAFQGPPNRSLPGVFEATNPLAGARQVLHLYQDASGGASVQQSDFGSRRLGPDGQTPYYNTAPGFFTIDTTDGVLFFVPDDRLGDFRPMAFDGATFDIVSTPESPLAFIPEDGHAPALFQAVAMFLRHDEMPDQTFSLDGDPQSMVLLPSGFGLPFAMPLLDAPGGAPSLEVGWDLGGRELLYQQVQDTLTSEIPWIHSYRHGIPSYGIYCLDRLALTDAVWSDGTPLTEADLESFLPAEYRRALGASCMAVQEEEGLLHGTAWQAWTTEDPPEFDLETARAMLEEAGWVSGPDGSLQSSP